MNNWNIFDFFKKKEDCNIFKDANNIKKYKCSEESIDNSNFAVDNTFSISRINEFDLEKDKYIESDLISLGWWPNEIRCFIHINRMAYSDLTHTYTIYMNFFDEAIKNLIDYFKELQLFEKEDKIPCLKEFKDFCVLEDQNLHNIWSKIIEEDNCRMEDFEVRKRAPNEKKYDIIRKIISKTLTFYFPETKANNITCNYMDNKVRTLKWSELCLFECLNDIRIYHTTMDDMLRHILVGFVENEHTHISMSDLFEGMISDLRYKIKRYNTITKQIKQQNLKTRSRSKSETPPQFLSKSQILSTNTNTTQNPQYKKKYRKSYNTDKLIRLRSISHDYKFNDKTNDYKINNKTNDKPNDYKEIKTKERSSSLDCDRTFCLKHEKINKEIKNVKTDEDISMKKSPRSQSDMGHKARVIVDKVNICIDLFDYVNYQITLFSMVFSNNSNTQQIPYNIKKLKNYPQDKINQIYYIYHYFLKRINSANNKNSMLKRNVSFELLKEKTDYEQKDEHLGSPHYISNRTTNTLTPLLTRSLSSSFFQNKHDKIISASRTRKR
jgi:hypothetical protein